MQQRRKDDKAFGELVDMVERNNRRHRWAILLIAIGLGLLLWFQSCSNSDRISELQDSRIENTTNVCVERNNQNQVIQEFILFTVGTDGAGARVRARAVASFPVKDRNPVEALRKCRAEAEKKVKP